MDFEKNYNVNHDRLCVVRLQWIKSDVSQLVYNDVQHMFIIAGETGNTNVILDHLHSCIA